jgi:glycosyltransferase involved in cell wall biosynthesis
MQTETHNSIRCLQITGDAVGGIRLHVHSIIDELHKSDQAVFYACSSHADTKGELDIARFQKNGLPVFRLPVQKQPAFSDLLNIIRLVIWARKYRVNLVHGHGAKGGLYARIVGLFARAKVVYTPHGGVVHAAFGRVTTRVYAFIERMLVPLTTRYVFESKYTQTEFLKLIHRNHLHQATVNYNGIALPSAPFNGVQPQQEKVPRLLVVGMLRREKGQDLVLHAARILKDRGLQFEVHVCGDGPSKGSLEVLSTALHLSDCVFFHGDVQDVRPFFESATLVVIPSRFESFGYVALEAAMYGKAVVASRVGGLCEIIQSGETGEFFEAENVEELADKVQAMLMDSDRLVQLARGAFNRCHDMFSVQRMLNGLNAIYREVL